MQLLQLLIELRGQRCKIYGARREFFWGGWGGLGVSPWVRGGLQALVL
jgi:hypothetical protein